MISTCHSIDDANFDSDLFKALSARFLYCKVTNFPFGINACLNGETLRDDANNLFVIIFCLSILASIDDVCFQQLLLRHLPNELD